MADLTARFGADFSDFSSGVAQAEAELTSLDASAGNVQGTLSRMSDSFSGSLMVAEAGAMTVSVEDLGRAVTETDDELGRFHVTAEEATAQLEAMGNAAPADKIREVGDATKNAGGEMTSLGGVTGKLGGMIAGAFTISAVIGFAKSVADTADVIDKTAAQTGMLTDEVQALMAIAGDTGVEFKSLVSASQGLEAALGSNDEGVIGAIKKLGINFEDFKGLGTYDQMVAIGQSIAAIQDPTERASAAAAIFGAKWKEILPALVSDMEAVGEAAPKMSKEAIAAFDQLDKDWNKLKATAISWAGETIGALVNVGIAFETWMDQMTTLPDVWNAAMGKAGSIDEARLARLALRELADETKNVGTAATAAVEPVVQFGNAGGDLAKKMREAYDARLKKSIDEDAAAAKKAAEEMKGYAAAFEAVNTPTVDFHTTLDGLDEQFVTHIQNLLRAGKELTEVAKAYDLTKTEAAAFKASQDEAAKGLAAATREAEGLTAALNKEATESMKQFATVSGDSLQTIADKANDAYGHMKSNSAMYSEQAIEDQYKVAQAAQTAANDFQLAQQSAASAAAQAHADAAEAVTMSWSQAMSAVQAGQGTMSGATNSFTASASEVREAFNAGRYYGPVKAGGWGGTQPDYEALGLTDPGGMPGTGRPQGPWGARAAGGPVSAGSPYMVGEQGPELFVPDRGGTVVPNGGGGGMVANIFVNGTGQDVARIINAELTRMMRVGRKWPSV